MAIEMNEPVVKAPWPPQASNDPLYRYSGSAITGMAIADQGFQNDEPLARGDWGVWFGANLFKK